MAECCWENCSTDVPPSGGDYVPGTRRKRPIYQRKYCADHQPLARQRAGQMAMASRTVPLGQRLTTADGYVYIQTETGRKAEHRMVIEQQLGRSLRPGESVHHINGIRHDNRPENLELWVTAIRFGIRAHDFYCSHCGLPYC